jgi:tryptophan synthase alpha chain
VVGFGIARPEHVAAVAEHADGVIVASALVDLLQDVPTAVRATTARQYVRDMKAAGRRQPAAAEPRAGA